MENLSQFFKKDDQTLSIDTPYASISITKIDQGLQYDVTAKAAVDKSFDISRSPLAISLSAALTARQTYSTKHAKTEATKDAVLKDLGSFPAIFSFPDVAGLQPGYALGWLVDGTLTCSVQVSWSNILTQSLSVLGGILPTPLTLDLQLTPALTASFEVSVRDSFQYMVTRQDDGRLLVSVNKSDTKTVSAQAGAGIGVNFSNPDEVKTQLDAIYTAIENSLLGQSAEQIDKLKSALSAVRDKIDNALEQAAKANIGFTFACQYQRIEEHKELLSILIADKDLQSFHTDLLIFKTGPLLIAMRAATIPFSTLR